MAQIKVSIINTSTALTVMKNWKNVMVLVVLAMMQTGNAQADPVKLAKPKAPPADACPACPKMVAIPGKNYEMGKYEVTQAEWEAVMGSNPSHFKGANLPVEQVSWNDIQEFLTKLNQKTGKQYRLPKEAEWEYACYGGSQTEYCGGGNIDAVAWYDKNSGNTTHPVGQKQANGYGLYDMSGNVCEWMEDCADGNCAAWRVYLGGSWISRSQNVRAVYRDGSPPTNRLSDFGFRLARTLP